MGCVIGRINYSPKVVFCLDILLPTIIIIMQECSQALKIPVCKCLWSLSCGGVSNMLLVLSITFHFHYYTWGCMCSTGSIQFIVHLQFIEYHIHSSCYIIIKSEVSILPIVIIFFRGCVPEMYVTSYSVTANSRICFGWGIVFVCLSITVSHYYHYANLSEGI